MISASAPGSICTGVPSGIERQREQIATLPSFSAINFWLDGLISTTWPHCGQVLCFEPRAIYPTSSDRTTITMYLAILPPLFRFGMRIQGFTVPVRRVSDSFSKEPAERIRRQ